MNNLRDKIRQLRKQRGLSQAALAAACGWDSASRIGNYEAGSREPSLSDLETLASALGVTVSGLLGLDNVAPAPAPHGAVWLISWVKAGSLCEAEDPYPPGDGEMLIPCPVPHSASTFALRVDGPSMDDGTPDGYQDGEIIFVDPAVDARHNSDVIARTPEGSATFKRLQETAEGRYLIALNRDWPERIIKVPEGTVVCGVVVASYKARS
ncbi:helix-turn-helix domain-containing protein [Alcanivorax sp. ZXX171]|nr:helix-turn-helix domain-containing protein [Alcanivorax sp. ZXX171]